jgi:hypothetical protein
MVPPFAEGCRRQFVTAGVNGSPCLPAAHISVEAADIGHIAHRQGHERWCGLNIYALLTQLGGARHPCDYHYLPGMLL